MNSVERIKTYAEDVPREDEDKSQLIDPKTLPEDWPNVGCITGEDMKMSYRDGPLVLKGLSFQIQGGEKVGLVGRTGYVTPYDLFSRL